MGTASLSFDHVHLISKEPHAAARWYSEKLGGKVVLDHEHRGAPQIYLSFGDAMLIVRGQRPAEKAGDKGGCEWGVDHFGFRVREDFDTFCAGLRDKGVSFRMEPTSITKPTMRIAFIDAPDGVSIELVHRQD